MYIKSFYLFKNTLKVNLDTLVDYEALQIRPFDIWDAHSCILIKFNIPSAFSESFNLMPPVNYFWNIADLPFW